MPHLHGVHRGAGVVGLVAAGDEAPCPLKVFRLAQHHFARSKLVVDEGPEAIDAVESRNDPFAVGVEHVRCEHLQPARPALRADEDGPVLLREGPPGVVGERGEHGAVAHVVAEDDDQGAVCALLASAVDVGGAPGRAMPVDIVRQVEVGRVAVCLDDRVVDGGAGDRDPGDCRLGDPAFLAGGDRLFEHRALGCLARDLRHLVRDALRRGDVRDDHERGQRRGGCGDRQRGCERFLHIAALLGKRTPNLRGPRAVG